MKTLKTICLSLILIFILAITTQAQNRIDYGVSQPTMLRIVYDYIHGQNYLEATQYRTHVYCNPPIYLEAGKCYIDWYENRNIPYTKESAYQGAVLRYSLTAHKGTYDIEYQQNQVIIRLSNRNNAQFYQGNLPTPTPKYYNYGSVIGEKNNTGVQIPTTFEYHYPNSGISYTNWFYISNYPNYWNNCYAKSKELESQGFQVIRYYPTNGNVDLRRNYIPGPTG